MIESESYRGLQTINKVDSIPAKTNSYYRPYINYILTPDKNLKASILDTIIKKLTKNGKNKIYIRTLKDSLPSNDRNIFEYISVKESRFNFDSNKILKEIIN